MNYNYQYYFFIINNEYHIVLLLYIFLITDKSNIESLYIQYTILQLY